MLFSFSPYIRILYRLWFYIILYTFMTASILMYFTADYYNPATCAKKQSVMSEEPESKFCIYIQWPAVLFAQVVNVCT